MASRTRTRTPKTDAKALEGELEKLAQLYEARYVTAVEAFKGSRLTLEEPAAVKIAKRASERFHTMRFRVAYEGGSMAITLEPIAWVKPALNPLYAETTISNAKDALPNYWPDRAVVEMYIQGFKDGRPSDYEDLKAEVAKARAVRDDRWMPVMFGGGGRLPFYGFGGG